MISDPKDQRVTDRRHHEAGPVRRVRQGQVLVKDEAAGVNFADLMRRADVYLDHRTADKVVLTPWS